MELRDRMVVDFILFIAGHGEIIMDGIVMEVTGKTFVIDILLSFDYNEIKMNKYYGKQRFYS